MKLLSLGNTNSKTEKSNSFSDKYETAILYLTPFTLSGFGNVCPNATPGCKSSCLYTAGRGVMSNVQKARVRRTKLYFEDRSLFLSQLASDIHKFVKRCKKRNKIPCIRLNGTSDIAWEDTGIMRLFPEVQFYDYTKRFERFSKDLPRNYNLTFSMTENNEEDCKFLLSKGHNVATVFKKEVPESYIGFKVIDGDEHDLRFIEANSGVIVGLKAKGKARKDKTGFVKEI